MVSNRAFDWARLRFHGTAVRLIGTQGKHQGIAAVYIDGEQRGFIDQFNASRKTSVEAFAIDDLPRKAHTITIKSTNSRNPESSGYRIEIDAFEVLP
jgi:hypothetical protein